MTPDPPTVPMPRSTALRVSVAMHGAITGAVLVLLRMLDRAGHRDIWGDLRLGAAVVGVVASLTVGAVLWRISRDVSTRVFAVAFVVGALATLGNARSGDPGGSLPWIVCGIVASTVGLITVVLRSRAASAPDIAHDVHR